MELEEEIDVPLSIVDGRPKWSRQFLEEPAMKAVVPLMEGSKKRAWDLGLWLHHMYFPKSIYRHLPEKERLKTLVDSGRFSDPAWVKKVAKDVILKDLAALYKRLMLTPGERLYLRLVENIDRYIEELSEAKGDDDKDHLKLIEKGKKLYQARKDIEQMVREDAGKRTRGGRRVRLLERRPEDRQRV